VTLVVREAGATDWPELRDLRLEMLEDTPLAYLETLAQARLRTDEEWQERARRHTAPGSFVLVAVDDGRYVGTMSVYTSPLGEPVVAAVYVTPSHRGTGTADALLAAIEGRVRGSARLLLEVHEDNPRAQAFYRRHGFELTGGWTPYALDPSQRDLEMAKPMDGPTARGPRRRRRRPDGAHDGSWR
jgi:ribosomal protein S18 acetylase RimI-like enzyme